MGGWIDGPNICKLFKLSGAGIEAWQRLLNNTIPAQCVAFFVQDSEKGT